MTWVTVEQRHLEWKIARQYLTIGADRLARDHIKIKRGWYKDKENQAIVYLTHSFFVFDGKIFAMGTSRDYIQQSAKMPQPGGKPPRARIKYGFNENGEIVLAIKIETTHAANLADVLAENKIATDCGVAIRGRYRQITHNYFKCYSPYIYFAGGTLDKYKLHQETDIDQVYSLAIQLTLLVHMLHQGQLSQSKQPYAHLDIKPSNIAIGHSGELSFIDYRFSDELAGKMKHFKGTKGYLPIDPLQYTKQCADIFALLNVLYLPEQIQIQNMRNSKHPIKTESRYKSDTWIFPDHMVRSTPRLRALLTKTDKPAQLEQLSALDIARELTFLRCSLDDSYQPYLLSEEAITLTNRLFSLGIAISKDYLAPDIIREVSSWQVLTETAIQALVSGRKKKEELVEGHRQAPSVVLQTAIHSNLCFFRQTTDDERVIKSMPCMRSHFRPHD